MLWQACVVSDLRMKQQKQGFALPAGPMTEETNIGLIQHRECQAEHVQRCRGFP